MFAISWIDINMILNMNIWSAQQNDNSNERTFNHTNLIISYRFGFFFKFNCEIDDFWFSTNQRSACLAKMPHWRVLRDHKSDLIRVIMFYYTAIFIIRIFLKVWLILYDAKYEIFIGWEICVFSGTNTFDRFTDRKPPRGVSFVLWHFSNRLYRAVLCHGLNFEIFLDSRLFCMIGEPMKTIFCGD